MWANAQHDGRPAKYRWRPLFNAAKLGWRPLLECRAVTLPRHESGWNLQGCPKLANRSQPLGGRSSPYYEGMWRRYRCLTSFFPIVDTCLSCEDTTRQSCQMVPKWRFFASYISASRVQHISDLHSKFALVYTMCQSMVDILSPTAEIRRGKKQRRKIEITGQKYSGCPITYSDHNEQICWSHSFLNKFLKQRMKHSTKVLRIAHSVKVSCKTQHVWSARVDSLLGQFSR